VATARDRWRDGERTVATCDASEAVGKQVAHAVPRLENVLFTVFHAGASGGGSPSHGPVIS